MIDFGTFKKINALLTSEQFLEKHPAPWLLTTSLGGGETQVSFTTAKWIPGSQPQTGPKTLFPIEKQPDRNSFPLMVTLGRALNNDIIIPDKRVSSFHAFFRQLGGTWSVFDAKSQNGTQVGSHTVLGEDEGAELSTGTLITLGRSLVLEFLDPLALHARLQSR